MNENYNQTNQNMPGASGAFQGGAPSMPPKNDGTTGKTVGALILGITAVVLSFTVVLGLFGLICGIVGVLLSVRERKEHPSTMATAALIASAVGLAAGAVSSVACVACVGFFSMFGGELDPYFFNYYNGIFNSSVEYF